ncbi:MAG: ABC transporter substrate-binding protein [Minwuiales bacterium]|nr:ABC transporter substrate-binding protein [Minwuiales bacterium]
MKRIGRRDFIAGAGAAGTTLFYAVRSGQSQALPVTASHSTDRTIYAAHMVAQEMGFMADEGITLLVIEGKGGSNVRRILATGQVGYALGDSGHPLHIIGGGKAAKMLMATDRRCSYANILIREELHDGGINSIARLAEYRRADGAKPAIAATGIGSGPWLYGSYILERFGVEDQFRWVDGGGAQGVLDGLRTGRFDAAMVLPIWAFHAEEQGFGKLLFDVSDDARWTVTFGGNVPTTVVYVLEETIAQSPDLTQRYINAMYAAMRWLQDADVEMIYKMIGEKFLSRFGPERVRREIAFFKSVWNYDGLIEEADFDNGANVWFRNAGPDWQIDYQTATDMRFIREARLKYG